MTEEEHKKLSVHTDKNLEILTHSVTQLTNNVNTINSRMEDMLKLMADHNVMTERLNNMDSNMKEFSARMGERLLSLEESHSGSGCQAMRSAEESIKAVGKSIDTVRDRVKESEIKLNDTITATTTKWLVGILIIYTVSFGTYVVQGIQGLEKQAVEKIQMQKGINHNQESINDNTTTTFRELGDLIHEMNEKLNRNYGQILGMQNAHTPKR